MALSNNGWELASPRKRYLGQIIDGAIAWGIFLLALDFESRLAFFEEGRGLVAAILALGYFVLSDALPRGQSIGKRLLKLSVINENGQGYCTVWQACLRNLLTPILGAIDAVFILSKKRQRIGDMMAKTLVVSAKSQ